MTAFEEPWTHRVLRWARKNKSLVSAAAALLITAVIGFAISTVLVAGERNEAEAQGKQARAAVQMLTKVKDIGFEDQLDPLQKEFLAEALQYYEQFTSRVAQDPAVRLEHGLVYQQMGDIQRKLGKLPESEQAYRKAIEILAPLAAGPKPKRAVARTRSLLGDLLMRRGVDKSQIDPLYRQAVETQQTLVRAPAATAEDRFWLGHSLRSQAEFLRLNGQFHQSKPVFDRALAVLGAARTADPKHAEIRNELALTADARGLVNRDLGEIKASAQDFRTSLEALESLVAEFPTVPRFRESLAKVCNSLGILAQDTGDLAGAETYLRRELPFAERLTQDFPHRPEHQRELARTLYNLGITLLLQNRLVEAEPNLRRAVDVTTVIATDHPDDVQIRLDLAKCHHNLGELLVAKGDMKQAVSSFSRARGIAEALAKVSPGVPRYSSLLAATLASLGLALEDVEPAKVEVTYRAALELFQKLVAEHPENLEYRIGQARCLRNFAPTLIAAGHADQADSAYRRGLKLLETSNSSTDGRNSDRLRTQGDLLNNLGDLEHTLGRPEAEKTLRSALAIFEGLAAQPQPASRDQHHLAAAQINLGQVLVEQKHLPEATALAALSVANLEKLVAQIPKGIEFQSNLGVALASQAKCFDQAGKVAEAKTALANALIHQRQAVQLSRGRNEFRAVAWRATPRARPGKHQA